MPPTRRARTFTAGADAVLRGEGLPALVALLGRLDADTAQTGRALIAGIPSVVWAVDGSAARPQCCPLSGARAAALAGLGLGRHRALPLRVARRPRLLQPEHGRVSRLLVPLQLVREAHLGQSVFAAPRERHGRGDARSEAPLRAGSRLVRRRHLRLPRGLGRRIRGRARKPAAAACRSRSSCART